MAELNIVLLEADPGTAVKIASALGNSGLPHSLRVVAGGQQLRAAVEVSAPELMITGSTAAADEALAHLRELAPKVPWLALAGAADAGKLTDVGCARVVSPENLPSIAGIIPDVIAAWTRQAEAPAAGEAVNEGAGGEAATGATGPAPGGEEAEAARPELAFRMIIEASSDLMELVDPEGRRLYANPAVGRVLDDPEALLGTTAADDVHPNDRDRIRQLVREVAAGEAGIRTDYRLIDGKGETRVVESQWDAVRGRNGGAEGVVMVTRDVTARRRSEESLQNLVAGTSSVTGEKFFVALVRHLARSLDVRYALVSECVNLLRDRVRAIAYWANERWIPSFEYDVRDTTCEGVIKEGRLHTYPDRVQELFPKMEALKAMHAVSYMGIPLFGSSEEPIGHLFIMDDKPLPDQGRIKYILSLFAARASVELERMRSLKALKEAEIRYRTAVEAMKDCLIVTDVNEIITYANPAMLELCGYTWKEIAGKLFFSLLLPEEDWQQSHVRTEQRMKGELEEYEIRLKRKDGTLVHARVQALPSYDDSHAVCGVIGLFRPIHR